MDYGNRIYQLRKQAAMSQEEVANKLGVSRQSISLWETDQASPSMENLLAIAKLFHVSLDEIVGLKDLDHVDHHVEDATFVIDYALDRQAMYRRDNVYLSSKADKVVFYMSLAFYVFALAFFISSLNMETQVARIALIIGFISVLIGFIIYPLYMNINIMRKIEENRFVHIAFFDGYLTYDCTDCAKQTLSYEMIDYYIAKKDYLLIYAYKGMRIYLPKHGDYDVDLFLSDKVNRRTRKNFFW